MKLPKDSSTATRVLVQLLNEIEREEQDYAKRLAGSTPEPPLHVVEALSVCKRLLNFADASVRELALEQIRELGGRDSADDPVTGTRRKPSGPA